MQKSPDQNGDGEINLDDKISYEEALASADTFSLAGYDDWRLPNAKELQSILDYSRSPATANSAAIDPMFNCSEIIDEGGNPNFPFYWSSTTHANWTDTPGNAAAYVCFGEALGWMEMPPNSENYTLLDAHGAGSQRSDFKTGDPENYPYGNGPQGDVIRIFNFVRLLRDADAQSGSDKYHMNDQNSSMLICPNPATDQVTIGTDDEMLHLIVMNLSGKILIDKLLDSKNYRLNISAFSPGAYLIKVKTSSGFYNGRVVKQ